MTKYSHMHSVSLTIWKQNAWLVMCITTSTFFGSNYWNLKIINTQSNIIFTKIQVRISLLIYHMALANKRRISRALCGLIVPAMCLWLHDGEISAFSHACGDHCNVVWISSVAQLLFVPSVQRPQWKHEGFFAFPITINGISRLPLEFSQAMMVIISLTRSTFIVP